MKEKLKNKKVVYTIIGIISVLLVAVAITYAYWLITRSQEGYNIVGSACFEISLDNEANDITLTNQFPISDEEGLKLVPYEFTVTNKCKNEVSYRVALEMLGTESEMITTGGIKVALSGNMGVLNTFNEIDTTVEGAYESRAIGYGTLAASGSEGDSDSFELRIWIDKDASIAEMNKSFRSKITVSTGQGMDSVYQEGTLAYDIVSRYGGPNAVSEIDLNKRFESTETNKSLYIGSNSYYYGTDLTFNEKTGKYSLAGDITYATVSDCRNGTATCKYTLKSTGRYASDTYIYKITDLQTSGSYITTDKIMYTNEFGAVSSASGLYRANDDLGISYYYRGNIETNYLKLENKKIIHREAEELYVASDFVDIAAVCGEDAQCIDELETINSMLFTSQDDCVNAGQNIELWTTCEKNEGITELYFPTDSNDESLLSFGYQIVDECTYAGEKFGWTTCEKRELKEEAWDQELVISNFWRIIRVNGDGTIRLIYDGDALYENGVKHSAGISDELNEWYEEFIKNNSIEQYIADTIFCENNYIATYGSPYIYAGEELHTNYYYGYNKMNSTKPELTCLKQDYRYTVANDSGNKSLTYPISLITSDEFMMAGSLNEHNYLVTGSTFSTSTLSTEGMEVGCIEVNGYCQSYGAVPFSNRYNISSNGSLSQDKKSLILERPVINLVADVPFTGSGTIADPYIIGE